jgi:hypothetical protein
MLIVMLWCVLSCLDTELLTCLCIKYTLCAYVVDPVPGREFPQAGIDFLKGAWKAITDAMPELKYGTYPGYIEYVLFNSKFSHPTFESHPSAPFI